MNNGQVSSSFRDPSGFLFIAEDASLYRQVNVSYQQNYQSLMDSGLYDELAGAGLLVAHKETELSLKRGFEDSFKHYFDVIEFAQIRESNRILYLMKGR